MRSLCNIKAFGAACFTYLLMSGMAFGSTFQYSGINLNAWSGGEPTIVYFNNELQIIGYTSNSNNKPGDHDTTYVDREKTATSIGGKMVSIETFGAAIQAIGPGMPIMSYEDTHHDLLPTPDFEFGQLVEVNGASNRVSLLKYRTNRKFHCIEGAPEVVEVDLETNADFFYEETPISREQALGMWGRWVQVHPPRIQRIWVETDASHWDWTALPHPDNGARGYANSWCGDAVVTRFIGTAEIEFQHHREGIWVTDTLVYSDHATRSEMLDSKIVPQEVAVKEGRHFAAHYYRTGKFPHQRCFRTRDDELRGIITAVEPSRFSIDAEDWDGNVTSMTVDRKVGEQVLLDGVLTNYTDAVQVGREVRVFPERLHQRVVLLNERWPTADGSGLLPVPWFWMSTVSGAGETTVEFDGSYSYDINDGETIISWNWDFGDGTKTNGPQVFHTYSATNEFEEYEVVLTVTNDIGESRSWNQYMYVSPGPMIRAAEAMRSDFQEDMELKIWSGANTHIYNTNTYPAILETPPNLADTNLPSFNRSHFGNINVGQSSGTHNLTRYTGYVWVPENGVYQFFADYLFDGGMDVDEGRRFSIGGEVLIDSREVPDWGPMERYMGWRAVAHLERGMHPFWYESNGRSTSTRIGWIGPGVVESNEHHRMHFLYRTPTNGLPGPVMTNKTDQAITLDWTEDKLTTDAPFTLNATASSGLPVSFEVMEGPATISGNEVTLTGEDGLLVLRATQAGDATYNPAPWEYNIIKVSAPQVTVTFAVTNDVGVREYGAQVVVGTKTNLTDVNGLVVYGLTNGTYSYTIVADGYVTVSDTLAVSGDVSVPITLTPVDDPVHFFYSPNSVTITDQERLELETLALGYPAPAYQWMFNETDIPDATNGTLVIDPVGFSDAGNYTVRAENTVSGTLYSVTSDVAVVTVIATNPASIKNQPVSGNGPGYTPFSLTVSAEGSPDPTYQWYKVGQGAVVPSTRVTGTQTPTLTFTSLRDEDAGDYYVVVSNRYATEQSVTVTLTVAPPLPPTIEMPPQDVYINIGENASFSVEASGSEPLVYTWYANGMRIYEGPEAVGTTSTNLLLLNRQLSDSGEVISVVVSNMTGQIATTQAVLRVNAEPVISLEWPPDGRAHLAGTNDMLVMEVSTVDDGLPAPGTLTYTWEQLVGPGTASLSPTSGPRVAAAFPVEGAYQFRVTVDDGDRTDSTRVYVNVGTTLQAFVESGGMVVMEAENWTWINPNDDPSGATYGLKTSRAGYVGSGYMGNPYVSGNADWTNGCEAAYDIYISTPGDYRIWMRRYAIDGGANSCWVGLDGLQVGTDFDNGSTSAEWRWETEGWNIGIDAGVHTFHVRRREEEYDIDRIILTTDTGYHPTNNTAYGPAESSQAIPNLAPEVDAGADDTAVINVYQALGGSVTDDGNPFGTVTTLWEQVSGPGTATFTDASLLDSPVAFDLPGEYILRLSAQDGSDMSADELTMTVDVPGPMVIVAQSGGTTEVTEGGGNDTYRLRLGTAPTANVTVDIDYDGGQVSLDISNLVFTTSNWSNYQDVTVMAVDDWDVEGAHVSSNTFMVSSSDGTYDGMSVEPVVIAITDNDAYGNIRFSSASYDVDESLGVVTVTVERVGGMAGAVSVDVMTTDGSAGGDDYTALSNTVNWANGDDASKTVIINITDDSETESNETFSVSLVNVTGGASIGTPSSLIVTIIDNDATGFVSLYTNAFSVAETSGSFTVRVQRVNGDMGAVSVDYTFTDQSATKGSDYTVSDGTLNWGDRDSADKSIVITINDDFMDEGDETFTLALGGISGAELQAPSNALITIVDDDVNEVPSVEILWPATESVRVSDTNQTLVLHAVVGDDGNPKPSNLQYYWRQIEGPMSDIIENTNDTSTTVGPRLPGVYRFEFFADDGQFSTNVMRTLIVLPFGAEGSYLETDGMVVMEGENFTANDGRSDPEGATYNAYSSPLSLYVGDGYVNYSQVSGGGGSWSVACEASYDIQVSTAADYKLWMRRYTSDGSDNACWVGLNGTKIGGDFDNDQSPYGVWAWKNHGGNLFGLTNGVNTFQIRRRDKFAEDGYAVDRIILTTNMTYTPSGIGPLESARNTGNIAPNTFAGTNFAAKASQVTMLAGVITDDGLDAAYTSVWTVVSGTGSVTFDDASKTNAQVTFWGEGTYVLRLMADDGGARTIDEIEISVTEALSQDTDSDGIPDSWEMEHFGGITNAPLTVIKRGADVDTYTVYMWGVDPHDPEEVLEITGMEPQSGEIIFRFNTVVGRLYDVLTASNLLQETWPGLGSYTNIAGDGDQIAVTDEDSIAEPARFYRIHVRLPE